MPSTLPVDRRHSYDDLALYVQVDGKLVNAYQVEYEIYDDSAGYPGTAIAPGATRQDVTTTGNFATGCYGVYDAGAAAAWTPTAELTRGRVVWYFTIEEDDEELIVDRPFEVVAQSVTLRSAHNLFFVEDLVSWPTLPVPPTARDAFLLIKEWTQRIERYCRQHFWPQRKTRRLKWAVNRHLFLDIPLFGLTSFKDIEDPGEFTISELVVLAGVDEDRRNPKIEMRYALPTYGLPEMTTVRVNGVWGFIEEDTLDAPISLAQIALKAIGQLLYQELLGVTVTTSEPTGPLKREKTDGHEVEYAVVASMVRSGMSALLKTNELRDQLDLYRAPIGIASTGAR